MRINGLGARLLPLLTLFVALFLTTAWYVWQTINTVKVSGPIYQKITLGNELIADILPPPMFVIEAQLLAQELANSNDPAEINALIAAGDGLKVQFETRTEYWKKQLADSPMRETFLVNAHRSAAELFQIRDEKLVPAARAGDRAALLVALKEMNARFEKHRLAIDATVKLAQAGNSSYEQSANEAIRRSLNISLLLGALTLAVVGALTWLAMRTSKQLSVRIAIASSVATRIAEGDLTTNVPNVGDSDETGQLLRAISQMNGNLRALVSKAKQSSVELMSAATEYAATARQQETTVHSFGASTNQIAAAVKEINATSLELLRTMDGVTLVATETAVSAENGQSGLRNLDQTMDRLALAANTMSSRLAAIRSEAADITSVVTTISKVADQTNLLSINAAIEAEKAGEQGLGFLVLAREIRRLADQTAVATVDIEHMVKQMQTAVSAGVMEIDRFAEEVKSGVSNVQNVGSQFGQIIAQVRTLSGRFESVNDGMRAQAQGAGQIGDAIGHLMDGATQTSTSLREFNSATESLRDAVQSLKSEISQFNVGELK
jgi:methyl-accepting chemotaxis protein WspA